eukprot:SAG31_NODE_12909_length_907_cov_1.044554_2_plen_28_part_01
MLGAVIAARDQLIRNGADGKDITGSPAG